jgi:hypothetical protein
VRTWEEHNDPVSLPVPQGEVKLTDERERHIAERHPDLLPEHRPRIAETVAQPDQIRRSARFGSARLFSRGTLTSGRVSMWWSSSANGTRVSVTWIITAYIARTLAEGEVEWKRD